MPGTTRESRQCNRRLSGDSLQGNVARLILGEPEIGYCGARAERLRMHQPALEVGRRIGRDSADIRPLKKAYGATMNIVFDTTSGAASWPRSTPVENVNAGFNRLTFDGLISASSLSRVF